MGRRSRMIWERRNRRARERREGQGNDPAAGKPADRAAELETELKDMADGDYASWHSPRCSEESRVSNLEDILAFESVGSGTSLFEGLQQNGLDLPRPEKLDERQSAEKVVEVLRALATLRIFLIGFEHMSPRDAYSTLWSETLWEGCYYEKRNPDACTFIDVSHSLSREEMLQLLESLKSDDAVQ